MSKIPQSIKEFLKDSEKEFRVLFKKYEKATLDLTKEVNIDTTEKMYMDMIFPYVKKHLLHFYIAINAWGLKSPVVEILDDFYDQLYFKLKPHQKVNILNAQMFSRSNIIKLQKQGREQEAIRDLNNFFFILNLRYFSKKKFDKSVATKFIYDNYDRFEKHLRYLTAERQKEFIQKLRGIEDKYKLQIKSSRSVEINLLDFTYNNKLQKDPVRYFYADDFGYSIYILALMERHKKDCITFKGEAVIIEWDGRKKNNGMFFRVEKEFANSNSFEVIKKKLLKELLECKQKGLLGIVQFYLPLHANMLIYNPFNNTIEHFEPHGSNYGGSDLDEKDFHKSIKNFWEKQKIIKGLKYLRPSLICPRFDGLQPIGESNKRGDDIIKGNESIRSVEKGVKDPGGFCLNWSVLYADLRLTYPRDKPSDLIDKVIKELKKKKQTIGDYGLQFIRGFANQITPLHNEWVKLYEKLKKEDKRLKRASMKTFRNDVFPAFFKAKAIEFAGGKKVNPMKWVDLTKRTQEEIEESDDETEYYSTDEEDVYDTDEYETDTEDEEDDLEEILREMFKKKFTKKELIIIFSWINIGKYDKNSLDDIIDTAIEIIDGEMEIDELEEEVEEKDLGLYKRFIANVMFYE